MSEEPVEIIICFTCKKHIDLEDINLKTWIKEHINHTLIIDQNKQYFDEKGWLP